MPAYSPPDRVRVEENLPSDALRTLREFCRLLGVPLHSWHEVPGLARPFEMAAVASLAERIQREECVAWWDALAYAALACGINPDTAWTRFRRWRLAPHRNRS